ncbi:MAG TPA: hypothetical protein VKI65_14285, partial [Gemmataceae bacterium]|nr:hypothetical protein [Gemmataceae bacterium]
MHGRDLQSVTGLLADMPLETKLLQRSGERATFRVKPPHDAWLGIHQLRALTSESASMPRLFVIDELPLIRQRAGNHSMAQAQPLSLPAAVAGQTSRGKVDYYRFKLDAPVALTFEVAARRLGTGPDTKLGGDETGRLVTIDPVLRILDGEGRELAFADDTPGLTGDVRYRHRFEKPGEYLVSIHDVQFHGGAAHQYVLRLGDFPDAAVCYPAAAPADTVRKSVKLFGINGSEHLEPSAVDASGAVLDGVAWLSARGRSGVQSLALPCLTAELPEVNEVEPNDAVAAAQLVSLPVACNGRLETPADVDSYAVMLRKGQRVRVTIVARNVGSTIWPALRVLGVNGKQIAATSENGTNVPNEAANDPRLDPPPVTFTAGADGRHVIQVSRRAGQTGRAAIYRLEIEPFAGAFTLR